MNLHPTIAGKEITALAEGKTVRLQHTQCEDAQDDEFYYITIYLEYITIKFFFFKFSTLKLLLLGL